MHVGTFRVMKLMAVSYVLILLKMGGTLTEIEKRVVEDQEWHLVLMLRNSQLRLPL